MNKTILSLVCILFFSCTNQVRKKDPEAIIDLDTLTVLEFDKNITNWKEKELSEIADSLSYIVLESVEKSTIGKILQYNVYNDLVLVNCLSSVHAFERNGKYISSIGKQGKGPSEYIYADWVDYFNGYILIASNKKLLFYNKHGKYSHYISIPSSCDQMSIIPDGNIAICKLNAYGDASFRLKIVDDKGVLIEKFPPTEIFPHQNSTMTSMSSFDKNFYRFNNLLHYREKYNDTIFMMNENRLEPKYFIDLGKFKMPLEHRLEYMKDLTSFGKLASKYLDYRAMESDGFVFIDYHSSSKGYGNYSDGFSIYNKLTKELIAVGHKKHKKIKLGFYNNLDGGMTFKPDGVTEDGQVAFQLIQAFQFKDFIKSDEFLESNNAKHTKLKQLEEGLNINDNPIIVLVHLKR